MDGGEDSRNPVRERLGRVSAHHMHLIKKSGISIPFSSLLQNSTPKVKMSSALLLQTLLASVTLFIPHFLLNSLPTWSLAVPGTLVAYSVFILLFKNIVTHLMMGGI